MENLNNHELLFDYACQYRFDDFNRLFSELEAVLPFGDFWEAYLMRAQIKLYIADETALSDLEAIDHMTGPPLFPCLNNIWRSDTPNRFNVFNKAPGSLKRFWQALPPVEERLRRWHGDIGGAMACQIRCEILYFMGLFDDAIALAKTQRNIKRQNHTDSVCSLCVLFRCHLAKAAADEAEQCMRDMIRMSETSPECLEPYQSVREWTILTTGWSGDTPRYCDDSDGNRLPIFEDRLRAIRNGFALTSALEDPFLRYAQLHCRTVYTMRQFYMDIFHAIYWFQEKKHQQSELHLSRAFRIAFDSGIIAPFLEYGRQIIPLLRHAKESDTYCPGDWLDRIIAMSAQYETGLDAYRNYNT